MKTEYEKQANDFLANNGIACRITLSNSKPAHWSPSGHHYRVTMSRPRHGRSYDNQPRRLTFDFWGSVHDMEAGDHPSNYDVLACISADVNCAETFADFCADFGESTDSIKAKQLFHRCNRFAKRLRAFFTAQEIDQLSTIN